jgi:hypothetical protein
MTELLPDDNESDGRGGFLRDLRERGNGGGPGAIALYTFVGAALALVSVGRLGLPNGATEFVICVGGALGLCLGFFACFSSSKVAQVLAFPGRFLDLLGLLNLR